MRHLVYSKQINASYKVAILVNKINKDAIKKTYIDPYGLNEEDVIVFTLEQSGTRKKITVAQQKEYIKEELGPALIDMGVEYVIVTDGLYFKTLTKKPKVDHYIGYVCPTEYGPWNVVYALSYEMVFYDPERVNKKIAQSMGALFDHYNGTYVDPGIDIIDFVEYPMTVKNISDWLEKLILWNKPLTCDIEGFSLKHYDAGIGTICFCWSKTEGIAFPVDILDDREHSLHVRSLLVDFFERFNNTIMYHHIAFDVTVLIYQLFMSHILDREGLLYGLEVMLKNWHCTKIISFLATNSCSGNRLGLKDQAQEYAGNYAVEEINDIRKIPLPQLLQYNVVDGLATWYVYEKNWPIVIHDNQMSVYQEIFKPALNDIIDMQLTGMPVDINRVAEVRRILQNDSDVATKAMNDSEIIKQYTYTLNENWVIKENNRLKVKRKTLADAKEVFNPNSGAQLIEILYEMLGLPVLSLTDSGLGSTDKDTLEALINHTNDQSIKDFLKALIAYKSVDKILTSFIPALEGAQKGPDGWYYLFGSFNLGGTVSGRLSSSGPNLQNLPATGKSELSAHYAKLIKTCFKAPLGWFFCGIDFNSLEDRISALTTRDPNKLKVYTDGYDGHSLRAYAYFGEQMPDIDPNNVDSINSIAKKYKPLRQDSKVPTFSLTYAGTYITIMNSQGWSEQKAKAVESAYHELYKVSDDWVSAKLDEACVKGYVTVAFGLRLRTPLLKQVIRDTRKTPYEASAEGRTAGNALGQSWCLLNNRAGSEFMGRVRKEAHRLTIKPCAQIHDAQYFLIKDDIDIVMYTNKHLINAVQWQNDPEIWHPTVKLGGEFSIFYPDWSKEMIIPNNATVETIYEVVAEHMGKLNSKDKK